MSWFLQAKAFDFFNASWFFEASNYHKLDQYLLTYSNATQTNINAHQENLKFFVLFSKILDNIPLDNFCTKVLGFQNRFASNGKYIISFITRLKLNILGFIKYDSV